MDKKPFWGPLVKQLRVEAGMSQRKLAAVAGVHRATLRRMENGETDGTVSDLESVLDVLGYEMDAMPKDGNTSRAVRKHHPLLSMGL